MVILSARIDCEIFDINVRLLVIFKGELIVVVELVKDILEVVLIEVVTVARKVDVIVEIALVLEIVEEGVVVVVVVVVVEQESLKLPIMNIIKYRN
jgi:hypothetical protein